MAKPSQKSVEELTTEQQRLKSRLEALAAEIDLGDWPSREMEEHAEADLERAEELFVEILCGEILYGETHQGSYSPYTIIKIERLHHDVSRALDEVEKKMAAFGRCVARA